MDKVVLVDLNVLLANKKMVTTQGKRLYVNSEIKALLYRIKSTFPSSHLLILAQENKNNANEYIRKISEKFYVFETHTKINKILGSELSGILTADDIVGYSLSDSFPGILSFKDDSEILLITNSDVLKEAAENVGWTVIECYKYAETNREDRDAMNTVLASLDSSKDELHVYVDIDHTLLNRSATRVKQKTILNTSIVLILSEIRKEFPATEFNIITSRPYSKKNDPKDPFALISVIRELRSFTPIFIVAYIHTGKCIEETYMSLLCEKVSAIRYNERGHSTPGAKLIFIDDNIDEINSARAETEQFAESGVTFIPVLVQCNGDLTEDSRKQIQALMDEYNKKSEPEVVETHEELHVQGLFRRVFSRLCGSSHVTRSSSEDSDNDNTAVQGPSSDSW